MRDIQSRNFGNEEFEENDYESQQSQSEEVVFPFGILTAEIAFNQEQVQDSQYELGSLCCFYGQVTKAMSVVSHVTGTCPPQNSVKRSIVIGLLS